jgi:beta-glucosidase
MKFLQPLLAVLLIIASSYTSAQAPQDAKSDSYRMKTFVDALMSKMTLDEKIGQLNLPGAGDITTGGQASEDNSMIAKKSEKAK